MSLGPPHHGLTAAHARFGVRAILLSDIMDIALTVRTPAQIIDRYASLLAEKERKEREKADRDARRAVAGAPARTSGPTRRATRRATKTNPWATGR